MKFALQFRLPLLLALTLQLSLFAEGTLNVTIINNSERDFAFNYATANYPNTTFAIDKKRLPPGETANVIGNVAANYDLEGTLHFYDNARFHIKDFRLYHTGQSKFEMFANHIRSNVTAKILNPIRMPTNLMYIAATVVVESTALGSID